MKREELTSVDIMRNRRLTTYIKKISKYNGIDDGVVRNY